MAELDYAGLVAGIEAQLKGDPRLAGTDVTQEMDPPTTFPCVQVELTRAPRRAFQLAAGSIIAGPDLVTPMVALHCWQVSVQSTADAARQRDALVRTVIDVMRKDYTIGGRVDTHQITDVQFATGRPEGATGIYAKAILTLEGTLIC